MTPKEKAIEFVNKFRDYTNGDDPNNDYRFSPAIEKENAKKCALITVDAILDLSQIASFRRDSVYMEMEYWGEVIKEIEKL